MDSDADVDADVDADADADSDADGDGDSDRPDTWTWLVQVCGLWQLDRTHGGTLRAMRSTCGGTVDCAAVVEGNTVDLRPTVRQYGGGGADGSDMDCAPMPSWVECEVPPGQYSRLSVWGEELHVPCFGGDEGDCEAVDCVQLPPEPLPEGCVLEEILAEQVCGPDAIGRDEQGYYSVVNGCQCPAQFRPGGCLSQTWNGSTLFTPLVARCSDCGFEDVCVSVETQCGLFDQPSGTASLAFRSWDEPIAFDVQVGEYGNVECHP